MLQVVFLFLLNRDSLIYIHGCVSMCVCECVCVCRDWVVRVEGEMGVWCVCSETVYVFRGEKG